MTSREEFEQWYASQEQAPDEDNEEKEYALTESGMEELTMAVLLQGWQAARATVPSWHDAPTVPGLWVSSTSEETFRLDDYDVDQIDKFNPHWRKWFGPIPKAGGES